MYGPSVKAAQSMMARGLGARTLTLITRTGKINVTSAMNPIVRTAQGKPILLLIRSL